MILAISGSLRRGSINSAVLRAAARAAARSGLRVAIDGSVRTLAHFDPDLERIRPRSSGASGEIRDPRLVDRLGAVVTELGSHAQARAA